MSSDSVIVFFGLRYTIESVEERARLEARDDARLTAARRAGLRAYWGRETEGEPLFLLIGPEIGRFGVEGTPSAALSENEITTLIEETLRKLGEAGLRGEAKLHFQLDAEH